MSEPGKPAQVEATTATKGTGPPEDSGAMAVTEKSCEKENGLKTAAVEEEEKHEKKEMDVKMEEAAGVNAGEEKESEEGRGMEKMEPMKVKMEEKETEEREPMKVEEEYKETKEHDACQETQDKGEEGEGKVEKAEGKGEEAELKAVEAEDIGKGAEGAGDKGEGAVEKAAEAEKMGEEIEDKGGEGEAEQAEEHEKEKGASKKRPRSHKRRRKGEMKEEECVKTEGELRTPVVSSVDRPVRERKTVERLVESLEKQPAKGFLIEKGQGTPLKDIPNVAYKLSKRKPDDIRLLHLLLFGRRGKAINFKSHIFQFSGFVWHGNEDKQRAKVKEKLDKCIKEELLDLCDVFDMPVSKATSRKEDIVAKLLDFMMSPRATTDVIVAEKEQSTKSRKRRRTSRGSALRRSVTAPARHSRKKRTKSESASRSEKSGNETDEGEDGGEENNVNDPSDEDVEMKHTEDENDSESDHENDAEEEEYSGKHRDDHKKSSRLQSSSGMTKSETDSTLKKAPPLRSTKSPVKTSSKHSKADEDKYENKKASYREKRDNVVPKKRMASSKDNMEEKKTTGKKAGRPKAKSDPVKESGPTDEELRNSICEILKEVDFNTATFTDILKKLASHYSTDFTARKSSIKLMIQRELTKLAEEAEDEDDDDDGEEDENPVSTGKEIEA